MVMAGINVSTREKFGIQWQDSKRYCRLQFTKCFSKNSSSDKEETFGHCYCLRVTEENRTQRDEFK